VQLYQHHTARRVAQMTSAPWERSLTSPDPLIQDAIANPSQNQPLHGNSLPSLLDSFSSELIGVLTMPVPETPPGGRFAPRYD
jgi:hypothetical protein